MSAPWDFVRGAAWTFAIAGTQLSLLPRGIWTILLSSTLLVVLAGVVGGWVACAGPKPGPAAFARGLAAAAVGATLLVVVDLVAFAWSRPLWGPLLWSMGAAALGVLLRHRMASLPRGFLASPFRRRAIVALAWVYLLLSLSLALGDSSSWIGMPAIWGLPVLAGFVAASVMRPLPATRSRRIAHAFLVVLAGVAAAGLPLTLLWWLAASPGAFIGPAFALVITGLWAGLASLGAALRLFLGARARIDQPPRPAPASD